MTTAVNQARQDDGYETILWDGLAAGETGIAGNAGRIGGIKTVQVVGTFNTETVTIEGSMNGTNFSTLHILDYDTGDYATAVFSAAGLSALVENPRFIRPVVSSGSGVDIDVIIGGYSRL